MIEGSATGIDPRFDPRYQRGYEPDAAAAAHVTDAAAPPVGVGSRRDGDDVPAEVPAHWMTIFGVEDVDASVAQATDLGGHVMMPARDIEGVGRFAVLTDPQGVMFGVVSAAPPGNT